MTPPNSGNANTMIKEEGNAETGSDPGNNFGQSNNNNNNGNTGSGSGQMQQQPSQQQTNSNSKQCNNAEVCVTFFFGKKVMKKY